MSLPTERELDELEEWLESEWKKVLAENRLPFRTSPDYFYGHDQWKERGSDGHDYTFVLIATEWDPLPDGSAGMKLALSINGGRLRGAAAAAGGPEGMDLTMSRDCVVKRCTLPEQ